MVRVRQYDPELNVLDAARRRLDRTSEGCDRIAVAYSGGKDSLALMHLVREMGATRLEVDLLAAEDVFKTRPVKDHAYGPSWYPIEDGRTPEQSRGTEPDGVPATAAGDDQ